MLNLFQHPCSRAAQAKLLAAFILALAGSAARAEPAFFKAEDALARQQSNLSETLGLRCRAGANPDEIIVCGERRPSPYRLPLGSDPEPGTRRAGEPADQREIMALNPERCPPARPRPESDRLDLLAITVTAVAIAAKAAGKDIQTPKPKPVKPCG
jgi:hypothetical protein